MKKLDKATIKHVLNALRQGTLTWSGRETCFKSHRKQVLEGHTKSGKEILKYYWQCVKCTQWFRDKTALEADHVIEIGGFKGDWNEIINRMYDEDNLQPLCVSCHNKKTTANASLRFKRDSEITDSEL